MAMIAASLLDGRMMTVTAAEATPPVTMTATAATAVTVTTVPVTTTALLAAETATEVAMTVTADLAEPMTATVDPVVVMTAVLPASLTAMAPAIVMLADMVAPAAVLRLMFPLVARTLVGRMAVATMPAAMRATRGDRLKLTPLVPGSLRRETPVTNQQQLFLRVVGKSHLTIHNAVFRNFLWC